MSPFSSASRAVYAALLALWLTACVGDSTAQTASTPAAKAAPAVPTVPVTPSAHFALPDFAPLVERYGPAVVNVQVLERAQNVAQPGAEGEEDPFADFFRRFGIPAPQIGPRGNAQPTHGEGSGFIVTPDGYILTNAHVVADADNVTVRLTDRREFSAKVVGMDTRTDVAVIKINTSANLPTVRIGNPNVLKAGEWVLAIGSPFGFENSATAGIVSATARSLPGEDGAGYVPFIQTDVPVNPGNSGGPLFNMQGEVVGINSQIFSRTGGYMGLSFAIPIDVAMDVREQLIKTGHVTRGRIGVTIQDVNAQLAESFGLDRPRGALVSSVQSGSPGEKAGLKPGDVVVGVDGHAIERSAELPAIIARIKPGTETELEIWRGGKEQQVGVKVALLDEHQTLTAGRNGRHGSDEDSHLGLAVRPLAPQEKRQAETDGNLVVEHVSGPAAAAGVQPGDIILRVNGTTVRSVEELQSATQHVGKTVALLIQRENAQIYVPLRLS
ncbi:MAG TPA: DegQ family serine endoprotease [Steroidobacteraceae bacterium]|jgi:serine protease Do|nr:DegQ family serine endoprotease [Steroidobacteraceae bacterium]